MINLLSLGAPHAGGGAAVGVQQPSRDRTTFECFEASLPLHMACMVLGSSLPDRNSKKETATDYISVVTAVGQPPTANRTPSAVTANPGDDARPQLVDSQMEGYGAVRGWVRCLPFLVKQHSFGMFTLCRGAAHCPTQLMQAEQKMSFVAVRQLLQESSLLNMSDPAAFCLQPCAGGRRRPTS